VRRFDHRAELSLMGVTYSRVNHRSRQRQYCADTIRALQSPQPR
jgi:hypothetical protein